MWLRIILGVVYVGMAAGQLAAGAEMLNILDAYDALPRAVLPVLAAVLIAGELACGAWFLIRPKSHNVAPVWIYTAVSVVWTVLGTQAWLRGLEIGNCGCFGLYLSQDLSLFVLAQDALLLGYAWWMFHAARKARRVSAVAPVSPIPETEWSNQR